MKNKLVTNETLLKVKEDHEMLGKSGTVYSIVDFIPDMETGKSKVLLGKSSYNGESRSVSTQLSGVVDRDSIETLFEIMKEMYANYVKDIISINLNEGNTQTKKKRRLFNKNTKLF
ncbi:hypothetical protein P9X10_01470 [Bacillus cereus]|nr:hypothetical protein [Bacillus cereus]